ncbi:MAG: hypothetical protein IPG60_05560 [Bacteroidetes bacterium]|nr:hypothetical protein [Bacteroidota bacterium]MBP7399598.1 hypothetical protein [Chitinophagales bacterium]MBK7109165.1 hypothetical protein [Bacteroidota bacterium]MBK8488515.1 hypothetical protein [Bacteroidota bacterium]MBK8681722.1 hypothetical protein [Bacteroidota bacterium]
MQNKPNIRPSLLWEYDLETFNWVKSYKIVIERVVQLGEINEWKEILTFYGSDKIIETVEWSRQLDKRDKDFTMLFLQSDILHAA